MKFKQPQWAVMLFCYFAGVYATFDKTHWWMWLAPAGPIAALLVTEWLWNAKPKQKTLRDYT